MNGAQTKRIIDHPKTIHFYMRNCSGSKVCLLFLGWTPN